MTTSAAREMTLGELEERLRTLLPETYEDSYEEVLPVSMGSAGLKFGADGRVAWDEIWGSFCDLAMAGGPPHRGKLLEPGTAEEIAAEPERYGEVVGEICRGINMVTGLHAEAAEVGWVRMYCTSAAMVGWMLRAVVMENVSARMKGLALELPAGPGYRVEKEIKNVVTAVAKTCHYWVEHTSDERQGAVGRALREMEKEMPLVQVGAAGDGGASVALGIEQATGLRAFVKAGWVGVECGDVAAAVWVMRMLVASNVLARREDTAVLLPEAGEAVVGVFVRVWGLRGASETVPREPAVD